MISGLDSGKIRQGKEALVKEALQHSVKAYIRKGEKYYVAECLEIPVVTQGKTLDEAVENLREAVALHLEGEDLERLGLAPNPTLIITMETEPAASVS
jgi:predicted RNase H-like HicB family nuclease